jgi:hypothetical protein
MPVATCELLDLEDVLKFDDRRTAAPTVVAEQSLVPSGICLKLAGHYRIGMEATQPACAFGGQCTELRFGVCPSTLPGDGLRQTFSGIECVWVIRSQGRCAVGEQQAIALLCSVPMALFADAPAQHAPRVQNIDVIIVLAPAVEPFAPQPKDITKALFSLAPQALPTQSPREIMTRAQRVSTCHAIPKCRLRRQHLLEEFLCLSEPVLFTDRPRMDMLQTQVRRRAGAPELMGQFQRAGREQFGPRLGPAPHVCRDTACHAVQQFPALPLAKMVRRPG